jgi:hypothetical protein
LTADIIGPNDGTLVNGPAWTSGKHGLSLRFDGVDDYITTPDSDQWDLGDEDFTINGWVNPSDPDSSMRLISAGSEADGTNNLWAFGFGAHSAWGSGYRMNLAYWNGSAYADINSNQINLTANSWNHLALVRSGTTVNFYFNGSPAPRCSTAAAAGRSLAPATMPALRLSLNIPKA